MLRQEGCRRSIKPQTEGTAIRSTLGAFRKANGAPPLLRKHRLDFPRRSAEVFSERGREVRPPSRCGCPSHRLSRRTRALRFEGAGIRTHAPKVKPSTRGRFPNFAEAAPDSAARRVYGQ